MISLIFSDLFHHHWYVGASRELGSREALWLQKQSDDRSIYEQMRALREENTSFKYVQDLISKYRNLPCILLFILLYYCFRNQNETLKREILEQEASYKKLIASANEKADENWVCYN